MRHTDTIREVLTEAWFKKPVGKFEKDRDNHRAQAEFHRMAGKDAADPKTKKGHKAVANLHDQIADYLDTLTSLKAEHNI